MAKLPFGKAGIALEENMRAAKQWVIPSEYGQEKVIMDEVSRAMSRIGEAPLQLEDMLTALSEACLNAMEHGNRMDSRLPVKVVMDVDSRAFRFRLYDRGPGFSCAPPDETAADKWLQTDPGGWGLHLIYSLADEVRCGYENGMFYIELGFLRESF